MDQDTLPLGTAKIGQVSIFDIISHYLTMYLGIGTWNILEPYPESAAWKL